MYNSEGRIIPLIIDMNQNMIYASEGTAKKFWMLVWTKDQENTVCKYPTPKKKEYSIDFGSIENEVFIYEIHQKNRPSNSTVTIYSQMRREKGSLVSI